VRRERQRGQGLVEFSIVVPLFVMLLLGMLEFGFAFDHNLTLGYATREGARVGSALVNGGGPLGCGVGQSPNAATVDPQIIAAVERVLTSPGSAIRLDRVAEIRIYRATSSGDAFAGVVNVWTYSPGGGPTVDGAALDFSPSSLGWSACSRTNAQPSPQSIGVSLHYRYDFVTALGAVTRIVTGGTIGPTLDIRDRSVMQFNPTN
jgi:hypothetical protein